MGEHIVNLTSEQDTALAEMGILNVENYIKAICNSHIEQKLNEDLLAKTIDEKKTLLS